MKPATQRTQEYVPPSHRDEKTGLYVPGKDPGEETVMVKDVGDYVDRVVRKQSLRAVEQYRKKQQERQRNRRRRQSRKGNR